MAFSGKKIILTICVAIIVAATIYLLRPLSSNKFKITHDPEKIDFKNEFLKKRLSTSDSLKLPNIILLMADDLGKSDISLYGSESINTPNIDAIGKSGITFSEAYVSSPICSPSRASLLTGRYQQRFGYEFQIHETYLNNLLQYYGMKTFIDSDPWLPVKMNSVPGKEEIAQQGLPPTEITIAEILKMRGYSTAMIGKWHLGYSDLFSPNNFGFDYFYGFKSSHRMYANENDPEIVNQRIDNDWTDPYIWQCPELGDCNVYRNNEVVTPEKYLTFQFADEAVNFMEENRDHPFFIFLPFNAPHTPLQAPKKYVDRFNHIQDPVKKVYNAMIATLDDAVGQITKKVEELGLEENTLIIFLSDNGGATYTHTTDNAPLRGGKITNFEGGINVPMMMEWKGKIIAGSRFIHPVNSVDIFSTVSSIINASLPDDRVYDGVDLLPYVSKLNMEPPHQSLLWQMGFNKAIRKDQWKLVIDEKFNRKMLFNLSADKYEERNIADNYPDLVEQLSEEHNEWSSGLPLPLWPGMIYFIYRDKEGEFWFMD